MKRSKLQSTAWSALFSTALLFIGACSTKETDPASDQGNDDAQDAAAEGDRDAGNEGNEGNEVTTSANSDDGTSETAPSTSSSDTFATEPSADSESADSDDSAEETTPSTESDTEPSDSTDASGGGEPIGLSGAGGQPGAGGAGQAGAGGQLGAGGAGPVGSVPVELVGIWQQTRASAGEYTNGYGENFSITSGFSVQFRLRPDGEYYFAHLASGTSTSCATVEYFDQSTGTAVLEGNTLTLYPTEHRLDVIDCANSRTETLPPDPIVWSIELEDAWHFYGGLRTYLMRVSADAHPFELTQLHREPLADPEQPAQPADFVLGVDGPFAELQGLWVAAAGTDSNFYDPLSGEFYLPELNGSPHQWIRFAGTAYETAVALQNTNVEGACESDVIYYEQGEALFAVLEDVGAQGTHFVGHTRLQASYAHLIVNIRECGDDDAVKRYDLTPLLSHYRWIYFSPASISESLTLGCEFAFSEWQSLLCTSMNTGFVRRAE